MHLQDISENVKGSVTNMEGPLRNYENQEVSKEKSIEAKGATDNLNMREEVIVNKENVQPIIENCKGASVSIVGHERKTPRLKGMGELTKKGGGEPVPQLEEGWNYKQVGQEKGLGNLATQIDDEGQLHVQVRHGGGSLYREGPGKTNVLQRMQQSIPRTVLPIESTKIGLGQRSANGGQLSLPEVGNNMALTVGLPLQISGCASYREEIPSVIIRAGWENLAKSGI